MTQLDRLRKEKDLFFQSDPYSPLTDAQKRDFQNLKYFPENGALRLEVEVQQLAEADIVHLQTNTGEVQAYERYGKFSFSVDEEEIQLTIFRSLDAFFLPFTDSLSGKETYGAGRYLEPEELPDGRFLIDFNLAYNPYCAYNDRWSCPLTPAENRVSATIRAGEKIFDAH